MSLHVISCHAGLRIMRVSYADAARLCRRSLEPSGARQVSAHVSDLQNLYPVGILT